MKKPVDPGLQVISPEALIQDSLETNVICRQVYVGDDRVVVRSALIVRRVVVIEGRQRQERSGIEGVDPGKDGVGVGLPLSIVQAIARNLPVDARIWLPTELGLGSTGIW